MHGYIRHVLLMERRLRHDRQRRRQREDGATDGSVTDTSQGMSVVLKVVRGQEQILLEPLEKHSPSDLHLSMAKLNLDLCPIAYCCFKSPNFGSLFQQPQESKYHCINYINIIAFQAEHWGLIYVILFCTGLNFIYSSGDLLCAFLYFMREVKARESPHKCVSVCDSVCSMHFSPPLSRSGVANLISARVLT